MLSWLRGGCALTACAIVSAATLAAGCGEHATRYPGALRSCRQYAIKTPEARTCVQARFASLQKRALTLRHEAVTRNGSHTEYIRVTEQMRQIATFAFDHRIPLRFDPRVMKPMTISGEG